MGQLNLSKNDHITCFLQRSQRPRLDDELKLLILVRRAHFAQAPSEARLRRDRGDDLALSFLAGWKL